MAGTLAEYIREDLRARLLGGGLSGRLTLREISRHYGVSLTPVREAVEALVREGVIRKRGNRRLEAVKMEGGAGAGGSAVAAPPRPPSWDKVLGREVLALSLRGKEAFLREEATAAKHGIGRSLLREVFRRLVGSGLLEHVPRRGWRVRPFREEELDAYLEVRELLELKALDLARPRLVREDLERILAENRPGEVDVHLHPHLVEKSGNRYIADFFERHGPYFTTLFYYAARGARVVGEMAAQHREILQALIDRRWDRAREALSRHIRDQRPILRRMMDRLASLPLERWPEVSADGDLP